MASAAQGRAALLLIDIQYSFLPPSGSLAVQGGADILPTVYRLLDQANWEGVWASQDYHPPHHTSFSSSHPPHPPFTSIPLLHARTGKKEQQDLWPDHCVQGTRGAEIEDGVRERVERLRGKVVRKGTDKELDAYSAFALPLHADPSAQSELTSSLLAHKITHLFICGLATDYCVRATVLDALAASAEAQAGGGGWEVLVVKEGVRGVDGSREEEVLKELEGRGAKVVSVEGGEVGRWLK
ncbi:Isochorismatase-like protein [Leucosporidium creatinivorum]|uniref:nicotinamidase n=1 Tax=Leucosporidium creatinivorum TaxID=106004 RepID=A0A1Y2FA20_9BASI|nr:Isochorismatase-like protein [Leucosporidium creatinivorum]